MKQCPYGRGILGGLVVGLYGWLVGGLVWKKIFGGAMENFAHLWRPMTEPGVMKCLVIAYLIFGVFYSLLFAKLANSLTCVTCRFQRGLAFGFLCWLPFGFACGLFWYALAPISVDLLFAAWLDKALFLIGGGLILSLVYGDTILCAENGAACAMPEPKKTIAATAAPKAKKKAPAKKKKKK